MPGETEGEIAKEVTLIEEYQGVEDFIFVVVASFVDRLPVLPVVCAIEGREDGDREEIGAAGGESKDNAVIGVGPVILLWRSHKIRIIIERNLGITYGRKILNATLSIYAMSNPSSGKPISIWEDTWLRAHHMCL